ncbi:hypothetical protein CLAFUW4_04040 [Fulvia fulva]|uniref:Uncharacterized protein n=1 Tax=Passalora fulva TaxID=5499 RepID=A0A9Q8LFY3_PASFU|nr:uncharacterized protein CLAFUR5_04004 [Fulvia fulva]KAK4626914.1 hypothetical protein CLAFUR4_04026 [Fulvia fulva]KAK4628550.1 hypothetical protein CLAFUR0_04027 [Fulvia fulva]UJO16699.1 hypothetical protein CLAFUR5_04004 [Fulvia fulva]WPV13731.1 hypothetical protein CLAFUW4_04040 [Fulvia fulva]WPV28567.1 hypothetical protein CLAFUW7_04029 [Fulvia fulva]
MSLYDAAEPLFIESGDLSPREVEVGPEENVNPDQEPETLVEQLTTAKQDLNAAFLHLHSQLPGDYHLENELFLMTYECPPQEVDNPRSLVGPAMTEVHDAEYRDKVIAATQRIRLVEQAVIDLRNQCLVKGIAAPSDDGLFGVRDSPDDGQCGCMEPLIVNIDKYRAASQRPRISQWLETAEGRPWDTPTAPSETIPAFEHPEFRPSMSCIEPSEIRYDRELISRWEAETIVTRGEADESRREHYRRLGHNVAW